MHGRVGADIYLFSWYVSLPNKVIPVSISVDRYTSPLLACKRKSCFFDVDESSLRRDSGRRVRERRRSDGVLTPQESRSIEVFLLLCVSKKTEEVACIPSVGKNSITEDLLKEETTNVEKETDSCLYAFFEDGQGGGVLNLRVPEVPDARRKRRRRGRVLAREKRKK